jgi:hypothetical protein
MSTKRPKRRLVEPVKGPTSVPRSAIKAAVKKITALRKEQEKRSKAAGSK